MKEKKQRAQEGRVLDLLLILLLALGLVGGLVRYWSHADASNGEELLPYTVLLDGGELDPAVADCLAVGDLFYRTDGTLFGQVIRTERQAAQVSLWENGEEYKGRWDEALRCGLLVWVEVVGRDADGRFLERGRIPLGVGERLVLYSQKSVLTYRVREIKASAP